jgi:hypothetical protein
MTVINVIFLELDDSVLKRWGGTFCQKKLLPVLFPDRKSLMLFELERKELDCLDFQSKDWMRKGNRSLYYGPFKTHYLQPLDPTPAKFIWSQDTTVLAHARGVFQTTLVY